MMPLYVTSLFNSMYKSNDLPFLDSLHLLSSFFKFDNEDNPVFYALSSHTGFRMYIFMSAEHF